MIFLSSVEIFRFLYDGWLFDVYKVKLVELFIVLEEDYVFDFGNWRFCVFYLFGYILGSVGLIDEKVKVLFIGDVVYDMYFFIDWLFYSDLNIYVEICRKF